MDPIDTEGVAIGDALEDTVSDAVTQDNSPDLAMARAATQALQMALESEGVKKRFFQTEAAAIELGRRLAPVFFGGMSLEEFLDE